MSRGARAWARRLRHSPRLAPVRRHLPAVTAGAAVAIRRHRRLSRALAAVAVAGWVRSYAAERRRGRRAMAEERARFARLRPEVLRAFYVHCIASMEEELESFPRYDRRKHQQRYQRLADLAVPLIGDGAVVVDVGCASGLALDMIAEKRAIAAVGFDLAPYGLHQRARRPHPPLLAQARVEAMPLPDEVADLVVFSEVVEHLVDAAAGMREVSRITRRGGYVLLTTNNAAEMPERSPLVDPLLWGERWLARRWPAVLCFRTLTWPDPIHPSVDPLPRGTPTHVPHVHYAAVELRRLAAAVGLETVAHASFEFPAPQSQLAGALRWLSAHCAAIGDRCSDVVDRLCALTPGVRSMGTHNLLVLRKVGPTPVTVPDRWWPYTLAELAPGFAAEGALG